mmetsp:Transcript_59015/g.157075  ORF Transcript_59015/g.157075 Transcript_59015/m.157075 type:complete len:83 (+) Transcript_59015:883-1131(+)
MLRMQPPKFTAAAQSMSGLRKLCAAGRPRQPQVRQTTLDSTTVDAFKKRGPAGSVYSLETCFKHDASGLTVGAQNPPQQGTR